MSAPYSQRFRWQRALWESDLPAMAKLVGQAQGTFMSSACLSWPSTAAVAERASTSERTVELKRAELVREGWLVVETRSIGGRSRTTRYLHAIPETANELRRSAPETANLTTGNGESDDVNGEAPSPKGLRGLKSKR